ncbi:MAG: TIGR01777 family oxidoreductase [bacterium]|nr:TIGR01777 family oxidoreductase [bacterium]
MQHKIVIAGGSGFLGQLIAKRLLADGHDVVVLTRGQHKTKKVPSLGRSVEWEPSEGVGTWLAEIEGAFAVVNLSGATVGGKRWSKRIRAEILSSRVDVTRTLVSAIAMCTSRPSFISTSGSGFYGNTLGPTTEAGGAGGTFLATVCRRWEEEAMHAGQFTRVAIMRLGVVLDKSEGIVKKMLPPFRFFIGGPLGSGRQWLPWVHRDDAVNAYIRAITNPTIESVYNIASPDAVRMSGFAKALGKATHKPSWLRVPTYLVRLLRGRQADIILHGQHIIPMRTEVDGFQFKHRDLTSALQDILNA